MASMAPKPLEPGHLVAHRSLQRLGEGIVKAIDEHAASQNRGERFVHVDFGREGVWSVPVAELVLVWQPPGAATTHNQTDWLKVKKKEERARAKKKKRAAVKAGATEKSRLEQHTASLAPWRDPDAMKKHMKAHKLPKKKRVLALELGEPEPEPEHFTAADQVEEKWGVVGDARHQLAAARKALRELQELGVHGSPRELGVIEKAEAGVTAAEEALRLELAEVEEADALVQPVSPKAPVPKTLPELAYTVLKEEKIDLLDGFMRFDENKDGVINSEELQKGFESLTQVRLPMPQVTRLISELEGSDGDGVISYMEFCSFFNRLAYIQEEKHHRAKFQSLFRNGEWPDWDGMTDAAQAACLFFGHSLYDWPPGLAETAAAQEAATAKAKDEERALAQIAEDERLGKMPWRTQQKRDLDWKIGWSGLPAQLLDPGELMSYEDWAALVGLQGESKSPKAGADGLPLKQVSLLDDEEEIVITTPRTLRRHLRRMLHRLGLTTVLAPEDVRSLRAELLNNKNGSEKQVVPSGVLRVTVKQGRSLKDMEVNGSMHPYVKVEHNRGSGSGSGSAAALKAAQEEGNAVASTMLVSKVAKPRSKRFGLNPIWNETLAETLEIFDATETLTVSVWDCEIGGDDDFVGKCEVKLSDCIEIEPPVSATVERWFPLSALGKESKSGVPKASHGEVCIGFEFTARDISAEEKITVAVNARRGEMHMKKGARDLEDVCVIVRRNQGFGSNARKHHAQMDSHRLTKSIHKGLNNWAQLEKLQKKHVEEAAHDHSMTRAAKAAAASLASCDFQTQQVRVAEVDQKGPGFSAASAEFSVYVSRLLEADRRLVQNAGGHSNVLAEMFRMLPENEVKLWQKRGYQSEASNLDNTKMHRTGAPKFGGSTMDGPGFLGGPDQPVWHTPPTEEELRLSPAKRKAKANEEKLHKERDNRAEEKAKVEERKVRKAVRASSPKKEGVPRLSKSAVKKKEKLERDGTASMNVGTALMTGTRRTENIEKRIAWRVKQQQRAEAAGAAAAAAAAAGDGGDEQLPLSPKYVQSPDTSLPMSEWTTVSHLSGDDLRLGSNEVDGEGRATHHASTRKVLHANNMSMSELAAAEVSLTRIPDGGVGGGGQGGRQGRESVLPRGSMWQLRESDRQVKRASERNLLMETWSQVDPDGSGMLDQSKIHTLISKLGRKLSDKHVEASLQDMGESVSFGQFEAWWGEQHPSAPPGLRSGHVTFMPSESLKRGGMSPINMSPRPVGQSVSLPNISPARGSPALGGGRGSGLEYGDTGSPRIWAGGDAKTTKGPSPRAEVSKRDQSAGGPPPSYSAGPSLPRIPPSQRRARNQA